MNITIGGMKMGKNTISVVLPKELEDNLEFLQTIPNPVDEDLALLFMGKNIQSPYGKKHRLIILFLLRKVESEYEVDVEIDSFTFDSDEAAQQFLESVPNMSLIEFLFKSHHQVFSFKENEEQRIKYNKLYRMN